MAALRCFVFSLLFLVSGVAQQPHSVTLTWTDTSNPTGTTYVVERADGQCSGTPTFSRVAQDVAVKTYVDTSVSVGKYCYRVRAALNGEESDPSNTALAAVRPFPPEGISIVVR